MASQAPEFFDAQVDSMKERLRKTNGSSTNRFLTQSTLASSKTIFGKGPKSAHVEPITVQSQPAIATSTRSARGKKSGSKEVEPLVVAATGNASTATEHSLTSNSLDHQQALTDTVSQAFERYLASASGQEKIQTAISRALESEAVTKKLGDYVASAIPTDTIVEEITAGVELKLENFMTAIVQKLDALKDSLKSVPVPCTESNGHNLGGATYAQEDILVTYAEIEFDGGNKHTLRFLRSEVAALMGAKSPTSYVENFLKIHFKANPDALRHCYQKVTKNILEKNPMAKKMDARLKQILIYLIVHKYENLDKNGLKDDALKTLRKNAVQHITRALHNLKPKEKKTRAETVDSDDNTSLSDLEEQVNRPFNNESSNGSDDLDDIHRQVTFRRIDEN